MLEGSFVEESSPVETGVKEGAATKRVCRYVEKWGPEGVSSLWTPFSLYSRKQVRLCRKE